MEVGIHGIARLREWDATVVAEAELDASEVRFVALGDGTLLLEDGPDGDYTPFAAALERAVDPPYRAVARRQSERLWSVGARKIDVAELPGVAGDEIELTSRHGDRASIVDGRPQFGNVEALERVASEQYDDYVARARRLDGDLWELEVTPL